MKVVWITNKFDKPSCLGYRDLNMGVQLQLLSGRKHVVEVQFNLQEMAKYKQEVAHAWYEKVEREVLPRNYVAKQDFGKVQSKILRLLDFTAGERQQEEEKQKAVIRELEKK